jgi:drug/metabolite transporter (DMT)-like permease
VINLVIIMSVFFSSTSQLLLKKGVETISVPENISDITIFLFDVITNGYLLLGILFQVVALLIWLYVLKFVEVSYAYPFISLGFIFVLLSGYLIFSEALNFNKIIGILIISFGIVILARS